jgi:hypothetical protein
MSDKKDPKQTDPNQTAPKQTAPKQTAPKQTAPKQKTFVVKIHSLTNLPTVLGFVSDEKIETLKKNKRFKLYAVPVEEL